VEIREVCRIGVRLFVAVVGGRAWKALAPGS